MTDTSAPIELDFKSASSGSKAARVSLRTFDSYSFDKNITIPASAFRFTAPGVSIKERTAIRSGDMVELFVITPNGLKKQIATGIIDETDTHITPSTIEYVLTGRDMMGQLVDNTAVDKDNKIVHLKDTTLSQIYEYLVQNTRMPQKYIKQQVPTGKILFQTQPGETKINALQRYLEFANCLAWSSPNGQTILGKPNFAQKRNGFLTVNKSSPEKTNVLEARSRRNTNTAIRQIVTQLQTLTITDPAPFTINNQDVEMRKVSASMVGRSVFRTFSYGQGNEVINQIVQVGNTNAGPRQIGDALCQREIARENMKILEVEIVMRGHTNEAGLPYDVDQIYFTSIEDDEVHEDLYVYACRYDLSKDHGRMTTLRLCRLGTIVADAAAIRSSS